MANTKTTKRKSNEHDSEQPKTLCVESTVSHQNTVSPKRSSGYASGTSSGSYKDTAKTPVSYRFELQRIRIIISINIVCFIVYVKLYRRCIKLLKLYVWLRVICINVKHARFNICLHFVSFRTTSGRTTSGRTTCGLFSEG